MKQAGFEVPETTYVLDFEDEKYQGLEVRMTEMTMGEILDGVDFSWLSNATSLPADEMNSRIASLYGMFTEHLQGWNAVRKGKPVPATLDGVRSMGAGFVGPIVKTWIQAVIGVPAPLAAESQNGDQALEESLPMETLQENLAS